MEGTEKIYCVDHNDNNAALMSALCNNNRGAEMAALMNGGMNNWMNNPFIYLVFLMMFGRNGLWGNDGVQTGENFNSRQIAALQDVVNTNHNNDLVMSAMQDNQAAIRELAQTFNCDINSMQNAICGVKSAIEQVGGAVGFSSERVINAANLGNLNIIQQLKDCCCENKLTATTQGYENRIATLNQTNALQSGQNNIANAIAEARTYTNTGLERGFASVAYETQRQTCDIVNNANANTQRIIDTLNCHWQTETSQALQDAKFEISQLRQNQYLINNLGGGCSCNA